MSRTSKEKTISLLKQARSIALVVLIVLSFRSSVADWNDVPTGSMKPNILEGDRIYVNKLAYDFKVPFTTWHLAEWEDPKRGEVVVFFSPADGIRLVKRVIGVPGDVVELRNNRLLINGKAAAYEPVAAELQKEIARQMGIDGEGKEFSYELMSDQKHPMMLNPMGPSKKSSFGPFTVPPGKYFMMGDNRDNSTDSRFYGPVDRSLIAGRASRVVVSVDPRHYYKPRWSRFFSPLP